MPRSVPREAPPWRRTDPSPRQGSEVSVPDSRELWKRLDLRQWASRTHVGPDEPVPEVTEDDIPVEYRPLLAETAPLNDVLAELDKLVGLAAVKDSVRRMAAVLEMRKHQPNRAAPVAPHMIFKGSPGTGKTTVAKLMGKVFAALGLLYSGDVVVATRADLVAEYIRPDRAQDTGEGAGGAGRRAVHR